MQMKVYNADKTTQLFSYDLESGKLVEDKLLIAHHPAEPEIKEVKHREVKRFHNGGASAEWVVDVEGVPAKEAWDEYEDILVYRPFNAEELQQKRVSEIRKRLSQLSEDFVQSWAGAYIADIEERKKEFAELHNELRSILGKTPRTYY